jgi:hypothetical protein
MEKAVRKKIAFAVKRALEPEYTSVDGAGELSSLSPWTWRRYVYEGKVSSVKIGKRLLIPLSEIRLVLAEGTRPRVED